MPDQPKPALRDLEDWLTSAPGREASIKFTPEGFDCHIWERSRDGKLYGAQRTEPTVDQAISRALTRFRADALLMSEEFDYG